MKAHIGPLGKLDCLWSNKNCFQLKNDRFLTGFWGEGQYWVSHSCYLQIHVKSQCCLTAVIEQKLMASTWQCCWQFFAFNLVFSSLNSSCCVVPLPPPPVFCFSFNNSCQNSQTRLKLLLRVSQAVEFLWSKVKWVGTAKKKVQQV